MMKYLPQIALLSIAVTGTAAAVGPPDVKVPDEAASNIKRFVGHWSYETTLKAGDKSGTLKGTLDCAPAIGSVGALCTAHATGPAGPQDTLLLIGYDSGDQVIVFTELTDHGIVETYPTSWHGDAFTLHGSGKDPASGKAARVLEKGSFAADGNSLTQHMTVHVGDALVADVTTVSHRVK